MSQKSLRREYSLVGSQPSGSTSDPAAAWTPGLPRGNGSAVGVGDSEGERYERLFERLDVNRDGRIDVHDLTEALRTLCVPILPGHAQRLLDNCCPNAEGHVDFTSFLHYVVEHEKALRLSFNSLDHNNDGYIDAHEMVDAFHKLGVSIDLLEARRLIRRMDREETLMINWDEWREFFLFHPSSHIDDIVTYWRHTTTMDVGEPGAVPSELTEAELRTGVWWRHLVAGAVAGSVSRTCTAPLDRLKLMLMVYGSRSNGLGMGTALRNMLHEGGVRSLWRGNGVNVLKIAPESALKFMAYEQIKRLMKSTSPHELGMLERFAAGSAAGVFSQTAIYPLEVLKTRLALGRSGQYSGIADCAMQIYRAEGPRSFARGYLTNLLGIIPYAGIDLCVYETLKRAYIRRRFNSPGEEGDPGERDPGVLVLLGCGTLSSTAGQLVSYPLALVRTRLQANVSLGAREQTLTGLLRSIIQSEGLTGLYRGIVPNFLKVAPAVSISYVVYEKVRRLLGVEMS